MPDPRFLQHFSPPTPLSGTGVVPTDQGFAAWTSPPSYAVSSGAAPMGAGVLALRRISMPGAMQLANVFLEVGTGGVTLTAAQCFVGVWDQAGNLVGLSADASGALGGTGLLTVPLAAASGIPGPPCGIDTPYAYVGFWWNGTTGPFLAREAPVVTEMMNGPATFPAGLARAVTANAGLTTIGTAPLQLGAISKNASLNAGFWAAVA